MERAPTLLPGAEEDLQQRLFDGLEAVDVRLRAVVDHDDPFIAEAAGHLASAGGKRFRPLLTLLCAEVAQGINPRVVEAATGVELTHLASLYHDDVMDEAELRRGVQSANVRYGNATSILVGDLLFGTASSVIAELGPEAVRVQAATFIRLCAGQIRDERPPGAGDDPVDYYRSVLADKTGSLIATSARYGAMFSGADPEVVEVLTKFGEGLGIVFQMSDDVLDVVSDAADFGKEPGADLREGKVTLPMFYVLSQPPAGDERLRELLGSPLTDPVEVAEAVQLLREHPAMEQARGHLRQLATQTRALLEDLGTSPAVEALRGLVDEVVDRSQ